nr:hypothetical protein [Tanacetum cinerariifolium]
VKHKDTKKRNEMYYPRFTKIIIHYFMSKDSYIPKRNKVNWHYVRDDDMFSIIKLVSRHQNTYQFGALLPIELTNEDIRNSNAYKEYYAVATGATPTKPKASVRKTRSSSDITITPPTAVAGPRLTTSEKGKQAAKASKAKSLSALSKVSWHYVRDDDMFSIIKLVSRHQNTYQFGALLPIELTNEDIRKSNAYKEYYAVATGATPPKPKASVRKTRSSSDITITHPTAVAGPRLTTSEKGKQAAKASKAKSLSALSKVAMTGAQHLKLVTKRSLQQTHISQANGSGADEGTGSLPGVPDVPTDKSEEELSWNSTDEEGDDDEGKDGNGDDDGEEGDGDDDNEDDDSEEGNDDDDQEDEGDDGEDDEEDEGYEHVVMNCGSAGIRHRDKSEPVRYCLTD